jgi:hypothetical protein
LIYKKDKEKCLNELTPIYDFLNHNANLLDPAQLSSVLFYHPESGSYVPANHLFQEVPFCMQLYRFKVAKELLRKFEDILTKAGINDNKAPTIYDFLSILEEIQRKQDGSTVHNELAVKIIQHIPKLDRPATFQERLLVPTEANGLKFVSRVLFNNLWEESPPCLPDGYFFLHKQALWDHLCGLTTSLCQRHRMTEIHTEFCLTTRISASQKYRQKISKEFPSVENVDAYVFVVM